MLNLDGGIDMKAVSEWTKTSLIVYICPEVPDVDYFSFLVHGSIHVR